MFRVSALAGIVLIGLSAGAARAQQVVPVGVFSPGCGPANCGAPQDACLIAVPCHDKHDCGAKGFLDKLFGLNGCKKTHTKCAPAPKCGPICNHCPPGCVPAPQACAPQCQPAPQACAPACNHAPHACAPACPPAPKYTTVPVKLMLVCRVPQPAPHVCNHCQHQHNCAPQCQPAPQACAPACQPAPQACAPQCPPGCVPSHSCHHCGKLIQFNTLFHRHNHGCGAPVCGTPGCSTCGEAVPGQIPAAQQPGQPGTLPPTASTPTAAYPQGYPQAYQPNQGVPGVLTSQSAPQAMPQVAPGPYGQLIQSIQAAQDRDNKALRDMIETRQATQAVVRALQASDANTVEMFEKMIQQMKGAPTGAPVAPPAVVAPQLPGSSKAPVAAPTTLAVDEMKSILRDLQSPTVRTASSR